MPVQQTPHPGDRTGEAETALDHRAHPLQRPALVLPAVRHRSPTELRFQQRELPFRQLRRLRRTDGAQSLHAAFPPVPTPALHRALGHPQILRDDRRPLTTGEPHAGLQPDLLTLRLPLRGQAPSLRIPHTIGIAQGSRTVTTRRHPEKVSR